MKDFFIQIIQVIGGWSLFRKLTVVAVIALSLFAVSFLVNLSGQTSYEPLFTNLSSDDMGAIITRLDQKGIDYQLDKGKKTILVPSADVLDLRLKMAEEGLPQYGGVGFELFDKGSFGLSDFEQKINYQRALEGELTRTITKLNKVEYARVHIVFPEKTLFADSKQSASASVIIKMGERGTLLTRGQVYAITHLVASSVEGLEPSQVTVVDNEGNLLTEAGGDPTILAGGHAFDLKSQIQKSYEKKIIDLISPVVGYGSVLATVSADIDFTSVESQEELVDPNKTAVVQETRSSKTDNQTAATEGSSQGAANNAAEDTEQVSYQVSKSIKRGTTPMGAMQKVSVAILVDGIYETTGEGETQTKTYKPRSDEELKKLEELVKSAIGFNPERGDQITVSNMKFIQPELKAAEAASTAWFEQKNQNEFIVRIISQALIVLVVLAVFLLVIRPIMKSLQLAKGAGGALPGGALGGSGTLPAGQQKDINQLVMNNPNYAVKALKKWIDEA